MANDPAPDGRTVISVDEGRLYDTGAWPPRPSAARIAHPGWLNEGGVQFSPDRRFLASWVKDGRGDRRLWRLPRPHSRPPRPRAESASQPKRTDEFDLAQFDGHGAVAVLWSPPGGGGRNAIQVVDATTGAARVAKNRPAGEIRTMAIGPHGRHVATGGDDGSARVWEMATGRPAGPPLGHHNWVAAAAFSPDGKPWPRATSARTGLSSSGTGRRGRRSARRLQHDDIVLGLSFSPDGRYLAAVKSGDWSKHPELLVWEVASGRSVIKVPHRLATEPISRMAWFRPDGRGARGTRPRRRLAPLGGSLRQDPRRAAGRRGWDDAVLARQSGGRGGFDLGLRLLDGGTLAPLSGGDLPHPDPIRDVAISPDGSMLLTGHETGSAQLWDLTARKPVGPPAVLIGPIRAVCFTPDGKTCLCVAADGTVRRWPVPAALAEPDLARLADRIALMTGQRMDDSQGLDFLPADEWRSLRAKLVGEGSTALVPTRPDADWHDVLAADAEQDGDAMGVEWHLDRLAALCRTTGPSRLRGRSSAAAGRRDEADAAYAAAGRLASSPQVLSDWLRAAAAEDEAAVRKEATLWNLDRAIALTPGDWTLYALRAELAESARAVADEDEAIRLGAEQPMIERAADRAAGAGDWKCAAAILTGLARNPDLPMPTRYSQAVACLKAGDAAGYRCRMRRHGRASAAGRPENVPPRFDQSSQRGVPWPERDRRLDQNAGLDRSSPGPAGGDREGGQPGPPGTGPNGATEVLAQRAGRSSSAPAGSRRRRRCSGRQ